MGIYLNQLRVVVESLSNGGLTVASSPSPFPPHIRLSHHLSAPKEPDFQCLESQSVRIDSNSIKGLSVKKKPAIRIEKEKNNQACTSICIFRLISEIWYAAPLRHRL